MRNMPSLWMTLGALLLGFIVSYFFYLMEGYARVHGYSFERLAWAFIERLGWWWWSIPIAASVFGLYYAAQLDRPQSNFGFVTRVMTLAAFVLYLGSWQNTGLGPFAAILAIVSQVMLIKQLAMSCAARRARPSYKDEPWLMRLYASLTTELDDIKRVP